jgi:virginiamycin B lyase
MGSVRHFRRIGAALVALSLSACGGGGTGAGTASSVPAASSVHGNLAFSITVPPSSASQSKSRSAQFVSAATKSVSIATGSSTTNIDVGPASAGCSVNVAQPSIGENAIAAGAQPRGITKGPDGTMWFVEDSGGAIGNLTTGGTYQRFPSGLLTNDLVVGPDGFLWIAQLFGALEILRFNTSGTTFISPYSTGSQPQATHLATGSDNNVYYTPFPSSNALYRMTSSGSPGGAFPTFGAPVALTLGPDGAIWFTESNGTNAWIGRLTTAGSLNQFPLPVTAPQYITAGSDGALWFTESSTNKVYRMTTSGAVTASFAITSGGSAAIVNGPDGALWFTEFNANLIGRLTTAGALTEFSVPTASSGPTNLAFSADGTLYFTEQSANNIGTLRLSVSCTSSANVPAGNITTKVTAYDATGGASGSGHALSTQTLAVTVPANGTTTLNLTLNGVVNSISPAVVGSNLLNAGPATIVLQALDAAGNAIVGPGTFVDPNGNQLTVTLSVTSGVGTLSATAFTAPPATPIQLTWPGCFTGSTITPSVTGGSITGALTPLVLPNNCL